MSDQSSNSEFENEFAKMLAEDSAAGSEVAAAVETAVAAGSEVGAAIEVAVPAKPARKQRVPAAPEGPNPYGIHMAKNGEVVTMTYLRKWCQCATRGMRFNREVNITMLMSPESLESCRNFTTGQFSAYCHNHSCWVDPEHPETAEAIKIPRKSKTAEEIEAEKASKALETEDKAAAKAAKKAAKAAKIKALVDEGFKKIGVDLPAAVAAEDAILIDTTDATNIATTDSTTFATTTDSQLPTA